MEEKVKRFLCYLAVACLVACGQADGDKWAPDAAHLEVQNLFKGDAEPTAKDALWTAQGIFKVGVIDDGTSRNGYAEYVCSVLYDYGFSGKRVWVQIIDIVQLSNSGKWVKLGEARCN